ncbi:precorrin-3B C(17)-methyltransferase [Corynebacterium kozikiae]|uniref:precorrin-3B C(17)-methyltransferase n=1 Tax=Corynebacterium kozikiae TaxID=2968469 RepID=UPI00211BFACD|nr:precorrin-3B C(17)-methyltransferase [Corynebacterium sp. 76QC2CO]MCQ9342910.1 precorrin-3B C(17)-methyltransferase [Corynebacterium sp. 76QC2CO]
MTISVRGKLTGVGVGPGDPELLTLKALKAIESADVIAFHARPHGSSTARSIAGQFFPAGVEEELLEYPVTTGITDHPGGYAGAMADFYAEAAERLGAHLAAGKHVVVLALGDPMLYSSYQHLHRLLAEDYPAEIIPGIPSVTAAANVLGLPLSEDEDLLSIIPGTLPAAELDRALETCDSAVIMKLGRNFTKVKDALERAGLGERAYVVIRVGMEGQQALPLREADANAIPYFAVAVVPSQRQGYLLDPNHNTQPTVTGEVVVLGLGPGDDAWTTPEVSRELRLATDLVGYTTYINRVPERAGQRRHLSDNKVEAERAAMALDMAKKGRRVAVVSSGDPGVFAMASAVLEVAQDPEWADVSVRIVPGMTAAQAVASRVGAPLGHDFGMVSLSNRLKPFSVVEKRLRALAGADMAFAVYNPASKQRRWQVQALKDIVLEYQPPSTPVIVARAVGSDEESVLVTTLGELDPEVVDMRTMLIVGASTTKTYISSQGARVYTSRYYAEGDIDAEARKQLAPREGA